MLFNSADLLVAILWGLATVCVMSPIMMLGSAYQASHVSYYHHRGYHMLERRDYVNYVRLYAFMAAMGLLAMGVYLFLL